MQYVQGAWAFSVPTFTPSPPHKVCIRILTFRFLALHIHPCFSLHHLYTQQFHSRMLVFRGQLRTSELGRHQKRDIEYVHPGLVFSPPLSQLTKLIRRRQARHAQASGPPVRRGHHAAH